MSIHTLKQAKDAGLTQEKMDGVSKKMEDWVAEHSTKVLTEEDTLRLTQMHSGASSNMHMYSTLESLYMAMDMVKWDPEIVQGIMTALIRKTQQDMKDFIADLEKAEMEIRGVDLAEYEKKRDELSKEVEDMISGLMKKDPTPSQPPALAHAAPQSSTLH